MNEVQSAFLCLAMKRWGSFPQRCTGTVYPKKYAHGYCFTVLCCGYTLTDFPISIRLTSLALWQSNDCPSASKATLMNMDKYIMWIHYERLHNHNKAKHNKTVCIFLGIYCTYADENDDYNLQNLFLTRDTDCAILIAHQIVMAKHGGSCVHFSGITTCGRTCERLFHIHSVHCYHVQNIFTHLRLWVTTFNSNLVWFTGAFFIVVENLTTFI